MAIAHHGDGLRPGLKSFNLAVILPSTTKELLERLTLIVGSLEAGNDSTELKNELSLKVDLLSKRKISKQKQKYLYSFLN